MLDCRARWFGPFVLLNRGASQPGQGRAASGPESRAGTFYSFGRSRRGRRRRRMQPFPSAVGSLRLLVGAHSLAPQVTATTTMHRATVARSLSRCCHPRAGCRPDRDFERRYSVAVDVEASERGRE